MKAVFTPDASTYKQAWVDMFGCVCLPTNKRNSKKPRKTHDKSNKVALNTKGCFVILGFQI